MTNICHYFNLLAIVYLAKSYFDVILHIIIDISGHITTKYIV